MGTCRLTLVHPNFTSARQLAEHVLGVAVDPLVDAAPQVNMFALRSVGEACALLQLEALAEQCDRALQQLPATQLLDRAITNIEIPDNSTRTMRGLSTLTELHAQYLPLNDDSITQNLQLEARHRTFLEFAIAGDYDEAFDACTSDARREITALSQAVLGDIDGALASAQTRFEDDFRASGVRFICVIELFRREQWGEANVLLDTIAPAGLNPFSASHLALGANHITPWIGYPFPDW